LLDSPSERRKVGLRKKKKLQKSIPRRKITSRFLLSQIWTRTIAAEMLGDGTCRQSCLVLFLDEGFEIPDALDIVGVRLPLQEQL